jgi:predicted regulator of Ras-like GTPase activity (Roadblock/LC7/MglB family)
MHKMVFKSIIVPVLLLVLSIAISVLSGFVSLPVPVVAVPIWLLLGISLVVFIIASVILYSRASVPQYFMIAGVMLLFYLLAMIPVFAVAHFMQLPAILNLSGMSLSINLLPMLIPILLSVAIVKLLVSLEAIETTGPIANKTIKKESTDSVAVKPSSDIIVQETLKQQGTGEEAINEIDKEQAEPEIVHQEQVLPVASEIISQEEQSEEIFFEDIIEEKPVTPAKETPVEPEEQTEEIFFEDIAPVDFNTQSQAPQVEDLSKNAPEPVIEPIVLDEPEQKPLKQEEIIVEKHEPAPPQEQPQPVQESAQTLEVLEDLPSLDGDLGDLSLEQPVVIPPAITEPQVVEEKIPEPVAETISEVTKEDSTDQEQTSEQPKQDQYTDPLPKLTESPRSKELDSAGKITAIGKLLVDHRDIENIIETNALMQSVGAETTTTNIISAIAGAKTNEKLSVLTEIEGIKSAIIVNNAGFIRASTLGDIHKEQVIGAMASGTFGIISKLMVDLGFNPPKDILFESETNYIVLHRLNAEIVSVFIDPDARIYNLSEINDMLVAAPEMSYDEVASSMSSLNGVLGVILASSNGDLLSYKMVDDTKNSDKIAETLPVFYHNLGVFIKNMDQGVLRKTVISTNNEILLITRIGANILLVYSTLNTAILPEDIKLQYETVINS